MWKIYEQTLDLKIGDLTALSTFDLSNEHVKNKLKERYGDAIPLDELVISPAAMFESSLLVDVE